MATNETGPKDKVLEESSKPKFHREIA